MSVSFSTHANTSSSDGVSPSRSMSEITNERLAYLHLCGPRSFQDPQLPLRSFSKRRRTTPYGHSSICSTWRADSAADDIREAIALALATAFGIHSARTERRYPSDLM